MKKKLIALLTKYGFALANEEDGTIEAALDQVGPRLEQRAALENEKNTLTQTVTTLTTERDTARTELATERQALANERNAHAGVLIDLAIAEGRIAPSERQTRLSAFTANFETARTALANESVKYRVSSVTNGARKEHTNNTAQPHPSQKLVALANEALDKGQFSTFEDAYTHVKAANPKILEEMKAYDEANKGAA